MANFKTIDDIQRERIEREHQQIKDKIAKDSAEVIEKIKENITKTREEKKKKRGLIARFFILISFIIAFLFALNILLLNVWVLIWVIKSLFHL